MRTLNPGETLSGKKVCIIGRSNIVGMPLSLLLNKHNAMITICHRSTHIEDLINRVKEAEILITCAGDPGFV